MKKWVNLVLLYFKSLLREGLCIPECSVALRDEELDCLWVFSHSDFYFSHVLLQYRSTVGIERDRLLSLGIVGNFRLVAILINDGLNMLRIESQKRSRDEMRGRMWENRTTRRSIVPSRTRWSDDQEPISTEADMRIPVDGQIEIDHMSSGSLDLRFIKRDVFIVSFLGLDSDLEERVGNWVEDITLLDICRIIQEKSF